MKSSLIILSFFAAGIFFSMADFLPAWLLDEKLSSYALYLLMFIVGVGVGSDKAIVGIWRQLNFRIILIPLVVILGSLGGAGLLSYFIHQINLQEAMAVGAGFGYYSLSAVIIAGIKGQELGVVALLANIIREVITLVMAPLLVRFFGKLAVIVSGGATAMDTTLPVVVKFSGKEMAVVAIFSGIVLSLLVPLLVPFILSFS
ncbi:lysine exporter LysO family protein [Geofilum rubicundum]|uniref:Putative surface protein n=1 Tax=Geofilum rubicundum JCM 15548 TaxID=1236989 RepID=A0A0E9LYD4_9BACT|nr:lysine exporter LysO family protein [Geofilum rubicundum]GAO30269.1 putative surface protein [Geofilum rubicundum JCM 15548]